METPWGNTEAPILENPARKLHGEGDCQLAACVTRVDCNLSGFDLLAED
jgi:hypothetical protein